MPLSDFLSSLSPQALASVLFNSAAILFIALFARFLSKALVQSIVKKFQDKNEIRTKTLGSVVQNSFDIVIFGISFVTLLSEWGIDIRPLLTGAGILGLAVGFGSQALVRDVVTGFFILLENQFNTGDTVKIGGAEGKVIEMKLRTTTIKDSEGNIHTIPNSQINIVTKIANR